MGEHALKCLNISGLPHEALLAAINGEFQLVYLEEAHRETIAAFTEGMQKVRPLSPDSSEPHSAEEAGIVLTAAELLYLIVKTHDCKAVILPNTISYDISAGIAVFMGIGHPEIQVVGWINGEMRVLDSSGGDAPERQDATGTQIH